MPLKWQRNRARRIAGASTFLEPRVRRHVQVRPREKTHPHLPYTVEFSTRRLASKKRPAGPWAPRALARDSPREGGRYTRDGIECLFGRFLIGSPLCLGV